MLVGRRMPHAPAPRNPPTNRHLTFPAHGDILAGRRIVPRITEHGEQAPVEGGQRLMSRAQITKPAAAPGARPRITGRRQIRLGGPPGNTGGPYSTMIAAQSPPQRSRAAATERGGGSHKPAGYGHNSRVNLLSAGPGGPRLPALSGRGERNDPAAPTRKEPTFPPRNATNSTKEPGPPDREKNTTHGDIPPQNTAPLKSRRLVSAARPNTAQQTNRQAQH